MAVYCLFYHKNLMLRKFVGIVRMIMKASGYTVSFEIGDDDIS